MSARRPSAGTRVALVQAPAFLADSPPNALALLSAHARRAGFRPSVHDASLGACRRLAREGEAPSSWGALGGLEAFSAIERSPSLQAALEAEADAVLAAAPDIVGFAVQTGTERSSLAMARRIKRRAPRLPVLFGGPQCLRETHGLDFIAEDCVDAVAAGEADHSLVELLRAWRPGEALPLVPGFLMRGERGVVDCGPAREFEDLDALPFMDFEGFDMDAYPPGRLHLVTSRGCVRRCAFCTHIVQQKVYRLMSPGRAVAEIRHQLRLYPRRNHIEFGDSLVNGDVRRCAEIARLLVELRLDQAVERRSRDLSWGGMAILHRTMTPGLLATMRRGGCRMLFYGLESGSQRVVDLMRKNFSIEDAETVMADTRAAGIAVGAFVMVGYPGETEADFRLTLDALRRNAASIDQLSTSICDVQKGSHLDAHAAQYGIELPLTDRRRWRLRDGSNTPELRQERHERLLRLASELGLAVNPPTTRVFA